MKHSQTLAAAAVGRDNNLNLMRVAAAMLVLLSHSFTVATGDSSTEPGRSQLGMTFGDFAVDVFFVMSGFLVTKSISRSGSLRHYAFARATRIFPGLWVALLVSTAVVCIGFSAFTPLKNLLEPDVWHYLLRNAIVVTGPVFGFPGAFPDNPYPGSVNASLWTLPLEMWMYILLAGAWALSQRLPGRSGGSFRVLVACIAVAFTVGAIVLPVLQHPSNSLRHASMFFIAACLYELQDRIRLHGGAVLVVVAVMLSAAWLPHLAFEFPYRLLLPYVVLWAAFVPGGLLRRYNAVGDYSYGIYIYAFPIQQMCAGAWPGISVAALLGLSSLLTVACAVLSWHLVEGRAMRWRARRENRAQAA